MKTAFKLTLAASAVALLAACGGGGSSAGNESETNINAGGVYATVTPVRLSSYPSTGIASTTIARTDYGTVKDFFPTFTENNSVYETSTSEWSTFGPKAHMTDVEISAAWKSGWTGKGVNISIIDDFSSSSSKYYSITDPYTRSKSRPNLYGYFSASYSVQYKRFESTSHGEWVANIAGGDYRSIPITENVKFSVHSDGIVGGTCNSTSTNQYFNPPSCDTKLYPQRNSFSGADINAVRTRILIPGIAGEALVTNNNVNLSDSQNPIKTIADIQGHLRNSASFDVINLSLGSEVPTTGRTFNEVMQSVEKTPLLSQQKAVITVAAGNGGAPCSNNDLGGCNAVAVALAFQAATKELTIVVGALSGSGAQENIATYSTRAGILANRFILAHGRIGFWDTVVGTSFAAPRVAGVAAILKQKFPALTSAQIANVILLSASKDINNDGADDFTGVSPIYGHGKLSLTRALALAGSI